MRHAFGLQVLMLSLVRRGSCRLLCLHGERVGRSVCRASPQAQVVQVGHGHRLGADATAMTDRVLGMLRSPRG
jgi:hypothetical protein